MHEKLQKYTMSQSPQQGNQVITQFSMACSHSHFIAFLIFSVGRSNYLFRKSEQQQINLAVAAM